MEEYSPVFDLEKVNKAIGRCAGVFSELELTFVEVLHVLKSLENGWTVAVGPEAAEAARAIYENLHES